MTFRLALLLAFLAPWIGSASTPTFLETRLQMDLAAWSTSASSVLTIDLQGQWGFHPHWSAWVDAPMAVGRMKGDNNTYVGAGNVSLGINGGGQLWKRRETELFGWSGLGLSIPTVYGLAATNEALGHASMLSFASAARALDGVNRFLPEFGFLRVPLGLQINQATWLRVRVEFAFLLAVPIGSDVARQSPTLGVESSVNTEFVLPHEIVAGLRIQMATVTLLDGAGFGLQPYVGYEVPGSSFFVRIGYLLGSNRLLAAPYDELAAGTFLTNVGWQW